MSNKIGSLLLLMLVSGTLLATEGKTVHRRTDKISENFKQLDLPPEEIDPDVAPPEPQKLDGSDVSAAVAPMVDAVLDESANEIASIDAAAAAASAPAASAAASAASAAEAPETAVVEAASPAKPASKPKPTKPQADADKNPISRFCKCSESHCDCCRKFGLPLLPSGPGCAKIAYLGNDEMSVSLKFGDITLASRRISSKRARPICVGMPGGYSKFCGRVYGLSRAKENFKACLAFELRSEDEIEGQLPVSCFKFGSEGLRVADPEPLPTKVKKPADEDDDDIFGFGAGGDDDDDEDEDDYDDGDDEAEPSAEDDDAEDYVDDDDTAAPEDADYGAFSLGGLLDELDDDDDEKPAKKPIAAAADAAAAAAATPIADQTTREHVEIMDAVQSKDDSGTAAADVATVADEESPVPAATAAPSGVEGTTATATKVKKSKKAKKNKKKKKAATEAAAETEGGFAYELLNGILEFFN
ncbi:uncharacterized protein LOC6569341 [Drosophila grimshawi]|nr:uncharacterized protein LOC6569341 [Drosophila grimshawi]XP_032597223.1 uncharacterized protein LOC6569341 [Drosophila grimshawi]